MVAHQRLCPPLIVAAIGAACGTDARVHGSEGAPPPPSLCLVVVDGMRADHVGAYGYFLPTTPTLDRLAESGWWLTDVTTPAPWSAPALAALLTGRYPSRLPFATLEAPMPPAASGLPERLLTAGWRTGAVVSHEFVAAQWGFDRGFERFVEVSGVAEGASTEGVAPMRCSATEVTGAALDVVDGFGTEPFFLLVHYSDPLPSWPARPGFDFSDPRYDGRLSGELPWREILRSVGELDDADRAYLAALYDGELAATDREIGRLLEGLEARGRLENTYFIATATAGMELLDHSELGDQKTLYDELVHVPFIAVGPGLEPTRVDATASLIDVAPTVGDWLGLEPLEDIDGAVLTADAIWSERDLFSETDRARRLRAVTRGTWKLIRDLERGGEELYELAGDPDEVNDLSSSQASRVRELGAALDRFVGEAGSDE